jgi:cell division protein ZapB
MDSDKNQYTEDDLRQLEQRIDELIDTVSLLKNENTSLLKNENTSLRQQKDKLATERSQLIEKTEMARSRVEAMISRLRSLELGS